MKKIQIIDVRSIKADSGFLIDDGETSVLCDSGYAFTGKEVADNIKKALGTRELDYIFLTHSHYDHAAGAAYVLEAYPNAKVVAGEHAANVFKKESAKRVMRKLDRKFANTCGYGAYDDLLHNLRVDICVNDGDIIKAGNMTFEAIWLPGHTRCSVGFYLKEEKLLLSTETIGVYVDSETVIPAYLVGYNMTLESIEKVSKLDIENMLIPHYGILDRIEAEQYLKTSKKSVVETANNFINIIKQNGTKADALEYFKQQFYHGYAKEIYPIDALELNTSIMIDLTEKELIP
ncbi:MAG: MBL fold metallo-hydrolase [Clostridia bacterium]|nr:MBL fold metallo-hydrolase [Clostridia bacterium]